MSSAFIYRQMSQKLVDVAMGREPADLVVCRGRWVCVQSGEIIPGIDVAVKGERIAYVGEDASYAIGRDTKVIEADDQYLVPGLLDGHVHIESSMLTVTEFVRVVAPRGTTGVFADPHEIANVFGIRGVRLMVDEAAVQPIHVYIQMPSCVPSAPGLETPGAEIHPADIAEAMKWEGIIGLGEVMNYPGVYFNDEKMHAEMSEARAAGKVIGGHYASPDLGRPFHGYVAGGPQDDHESTRLEDALARVRQGMRCMMRYGSGWHDVAAQVRAITEMGLDARHFLLVTDDAHSDTLLQEGHLDRVLRHAIAQGLPPVAAIQMMTINTATHFGVAQDIGMIAPGRYADIILTHSLPDFSANMVIAKGKLISQDGKLTIDLPSFDYPDEVTHSVHLGKTITAEDFRLKAEGKSKVMANVIGVIENQAPTQHLKLTLPVKEGEVALDIEQDIAKVAVLERHHGSQTLGLGLVKGFGFRTKCAVASTVAHDCHQMVVVGTSDEDMAIAANELARLGGGQIVVRERHVIAFVDLPIAGLMSNESAGIVAQKAAKVLEGFRECGSTFNNPNMQLSLLPLVVIPELRVSDRGLVRVSKFDFIPLLED